jgi:hypothetical protein
MALLGGWQYHLIWTPGTIASTYTVGALQPASKLITWDQWTTGPCTIVQPAYQILEALWVGATDALERNTHH